MWCDLGVLFEGEAFGFVTDTEILNLSEESDNYSLGHKFDLERFEVPGLPVSASSRTPPGNINLIESPAPAVSPVGVLSNRFASSSNSSPRFFIHK